MIGMQHHDPVHRLFQDRIYNIVLGRNGKAHVQEVAGIAQRVLRIDEGLPDRILVGHRGDGRQLGDHADRGNLALPGVGDVGRIVVEGGHCADHAHHRRHRMCVPAEPAEEIVHLLMHHRVLCHPAGEVRKLVGGRQFAVQKQIADFKMRRLLGQLLDRIAAIQKLALVPVDVGDRAFASGGRGEARVIGEDIRLAVKLANVQHIGAKGGFVNRKIIGLPVQAQLRDFV